MNVQPDRNSTARWRQLDLRHHLSPFSDYLARKESGGNRIIVEAEGCWLTDSEGNKLLDAMAGLWCVALGYGRKELAEVAYRQLQELPYYNSFFQTTVPPAVELAEKLAELTPDGFNRAFFGSSGSESNDTVVRLVRHYWHCVGKPEKTDFISREYAYHGSTMAAASLGGMRPMQERFGLPLAGFHHVTPPYWYDFGGELSHDDFGLKAARAIEDKILEVGPEKVAAFIGEPIQGAGGVIVPPSTYWPEVQRICGKYDVLLVADEVICGFGRTGEWFGSQTYDIKPDLITMAKQITSGYLPLSAVMVHDRVGEALESYKGGEFAHGYTYSGHPVCCALALENLRILDEEGIVGQVKTDSGPYLQECLQSLADHPIVGEVRGIGMLGAVELVKDKASRSRFTSEEEVAIKCRTHCFANGVVIRAVRDAMIMSPPLTMTRSEIDQVVERLRRSLDQTAVDLGVS